MVPLQTVTDEVVGDPRLVLSGEGRDALRAQMRERLLLDLSGVTPIPMERLREMLAVAHATASAALHETSEAKRTACLEALRRYFDGALQGLAELEMIVDTENIIWRAEYAKSEDELYAGMPEAPETPGPDEEAIS